VHLTGDFRHSFSREDQFCLVDRIDLVVVEFGRELIQLYCQFDLVELFILL
jgi:hypothetical protein